MRPSGRSSHCLQCSFLSEVGSDVIVYAAEPSAPADLSRAVWVQCLETPRADGGQQYFGYLVFDPQRRTLKEYDQLSFTVTNLNATVDDDTISFTKTSDFSTDIQAVHMEDHYTIDRRSLEIQLRRDIRVTALVSNARAGSDSRFYNGVCKKTPPQRIRERQM